MRPQSGNQAEIRDQLWGHRLRVYFGARVTIMRRMFKRVTKARLSFSGGPHAPLNMADSMEEVNVNGWEKRRKWHSSTEVLEVPCTIFRTPRFRQVLRDFHRFFGSRNSPTTGNLHTIRHVYRSMWPAREAKPRFGTALECSAHDCKTGSLQNLLPRAATCRNALKNEENNNGLYYHHNKWESIL